MRLYRIGCLLAGLMVFQPFTATEAVAKRQPIKPAGTCDGLPRVAVTMPKGWCAGLLAKGFISPRGLAVLADGSLVVADLAGWKPKGGSLYRLRRVGGAVQKEKLFDKLDRPNGVALGPDGKVYVGEPRRLFRFDPTRPDPVQEDVIGGKSNLQDLPGTGDHPLTNFIFTGDDRLVVNIGAASDNCEPDKGRRRGPTCPEAEGPAARGVLRLYRFDRPGGRILPGEILAWGLRNSNALAVHPSGALLQGENSRDHIDRADPSLDGDELPHDELNLIQPRAHYGWPYCFDNNRPSPEFPTANCSGRMKPFLLLPAHSAPLGMIYADLPIPGPAKQTVLVVALHGYHANGHRVVTLKIDAMGKPVGDPVELVGGWGGTDGTPMGGPVALAALADGGLVVSDERNGAILHLHPGR